jgi:hypothetical protein
MEQALQQSSRSPVAGWSGLMERHALGLLRCPLHAPRSTRLRRLVGFARGAQVGELGGQVE